MAGRRFGAVLSAPSFQEIKMKQWTVISRSCLPIRLPVLSTLVAWLVLDRLNAPDWVWGAIGVCYAILWIAAIAVVLNEKSQDIAGFGRES